MRRGRGRKDWTTRVGEERVQSYHFTKGSPKQVWAPPGLIIGSSIQPRGIDF